jgi:hypothetical protein
MNSILKICFGEMLAASLETCQEFCVKDWVEHARGTAVPRRPFSERAQERPLPLAVTITELCDATFRSRDFQYDLMSSMGHLSRLHY